MEIQQIQSLLEQKFQGVRKDGLNQLAKSLALINTEETIQQSINNLTLEQVDTYVKDFRSIIDKENSKAVSTAKQNWEKEPQPQPQILTPKNESETQSTSGSQSELEQKLQTLQQMFEKQSQIIENLALEKTLAKRNEIFANKLNSANIPQSFKNMLQTSFSNQNFKSDEEFNTYMENVDSNFQSITQELANQGLSNFQKVPQPNNQTEQVSQIMLDYCKTLNQN